MTRRSTMQHCWTLTFLFAGNSIKRLVSDMPIWPVHAMDYCAEKVTCHYIAQCFVNTCVHWHWHSVLQSNPTKNYAKFPNHANRDAKCSITANSLQCLIVLMVVKVLKIPNEIFVEDVLTHLGGGSQQRSIIVALVCLIRLWEGWLKISIVLLLLRTLHPHHQHWDHHHNHHPTSLYAQS